MRLTRWTKFVPIATLVGLSAVKPAFAEDVKVRCAAAYEQAQELRRQDRLSDARTQLLVCREICPTAFALDCERWRAEVDAQLAAAASRAAPAAEPPPPPPAPAIETAAAPKVPPAAPAPVASSTRSPSTAVYILGATAIAAFGVAGGLSLKGHLDVEDLRSSCAPRCDPKDVDAATRLYDIAWITAGVGLASLMTAVLIWQPWRRDASTLGATDWSLHF